MDISIDPFKITGFEKTSFLLYGFSPRHFKTNGKIGGDLRLGHPENPDSSPEHLTRFLQSLDIKAEKIFLVRQIHSNQVYGLNDPSVSPSQTALVDADAIITRLPDRAIGVLTADCIPIIAYDSRLQAMGVVHAGRKGTSNRILSNTITALKNHYNCHLGNISIGMGPGIGACCYEVDEPCLQPFRENYANWEQFVRPSTGNKFMLDLFQANREDALSAGVLAENIFLSGQCTSCANHRFFSYRKEGNTGRMLAAAMLSSPADPT